MRQHKVSFRLTSAVVAGALLVGQPLVAMAQGGPPPLPANPTASDLSAGDPPGRVGRVARLSGTVSFHTGDQDGWDAATLNYPVTSGNAFWTQPGASADIETGGARVSLNQSTEFDLETLNDTSLVATVPQGEVYLRVTSMAPGEVTNIRTPRGEVSITRPGRYAIVAGDTGSPTVVTVQSGSVQITGPGLALSVGPGQSARIDGADSFAGQVIPARNDPFMVTQLDRDQPSRFSGRGAPPPVVEQMTGYEAVEETGSWVNAPDYGRVWYPPVEPDWVPYRHGRWSYVSPWGWTWVDDAPWGFAPFHYGRWVEIDDRWAWTPVGPRAEPDYQPIYAPALVSFVGLAVGVGLGVGIGASVGWVPLGPREAYRPPYRVSNTYIRNVNITNVTNVTNINEINNNQRFVNQRGATMAPASAMTQSQDVARFARPVPQAQFASARPLDRPPVQPTLATRGITPAVARSLNLAPAAGAGAALPQPNAPGPDLSARRPGAPPPLPGGRPGGVTPAALPGRAGPPATGFQPGTPTTGFQPGAAPGGQPGPQQGSRPQPGAGFGPPGGRPAVGGLPPLALPGARTQGFTAPPGSTAPGPAFVPRSGQPRPGTPAGAPGAAPAGAPPPGAPARAPVTQEAPRPPQPVVPGAAAPRPGEVPRPAEAPRAAETPRPADASRAAPPIQAPRPPPPAAPRIEAPALRPTPPLAVRPEPPQAVRPEPRPAPPPQIAQPAPPAPRPAPPPQVVRPEPRPAPPPQIAQPAPPAPRPAPPPQIVRPEPRPAPPPQIAQPAPPAPRPAPPPQVARPEPRPAPPPQIARPEPRPAPPPPHPAASRPACPPGRPNC